jgi:preprotein translocase subunit SecG
MYQAVIIVHIFVALAIVVLVLLQKGRGAEAGAGFGGGGGSGSLFGARGSANFLSRTTSFLAATFFTTSLVLAYLGGKHEEKGDLMDAVPVQESVSPDLPPVAPAGQPAGQSPATPESATLPPAADAPGEKK